MAGRIITDGPLGQGGARQKQIRVGNQIELGAPTVPPAAVTPDSYFPTYRYLLKKRLLTADANDFPDDRKGGAWALTMNADKVLDPVPGPPFFRVATPLVAAVTFGSGGISRTFYVDVWNTSLIVPADSVFVEVGWTEVSSFDYPLYTDRFPASVTIAGVLSRVQSSDSNGAMLTRRINSDEVGSLDPITIEVPPFACGWTLMNGQLPGPGSASWSACSIRGEGGTELDYVDAPYLDAQKESLAFRPLPSAAVSMRFTPSSAMAQAYILFRIAF